jgi:hypothetical protein
MKRPPIPDPNGTIFRDDGKEFHGFIQHSDNGLFAEAWNTDETGEHYIIDEIPLAKIANIRTIERRKRRKRSTLARFSSRENY